MTINYGAIVPDNEGSLPYIFKGLFGDYSGGFSHIQYYYHDYNYGENELRNLWEYELDLSLNEVNLILGHSWEVLGKEYTYFFLDENCAYQMARILEVVEGVELLPKNALWTIPQSLIRNLSEAKLREKPLVKTVKYHPSRQSRLYEKYESLSKDSREAVKLVVDDIGYLESDEFDKIESSLKLRILDTLLDYYQYMRDETALGEDINNIYYSNVLAKRFELNPGDSAFDNADPSPPHLGRKPSLVRFNNVQSTAHGYGQQLTIRPAYYDALDADQGHIENAELKMGEVTISRFSDNIFLQNLDLISVESVQSSSTGLPGDKAIAWKLRLGYEQQSIACTDCLMANLSADIGYSTRFTDYAVLGSYIGFSAHDNRNGIGNLSANASLFANVRLLNDFKLRLEIDEIYNVDAKNTSESRLKLEARYSIEKNMALRFGYTKHFAEEFSIALDMYF